MQSLYEELVTMHKIIFHLNGMQQKCKYNAKALKVVHTTITFMHEWLMQYKGALHDLGKKTRQEAKLEKEKVCMLIQDNKQLTSFIANIQASYAHLYNSLDFLVKPHMIPSIGSLMEIKHRNQVRKEIEEYLEQLRQVTIKEYLEVNR